MTKCSYCGKEYEIHKGVTYILKDGTVKFLCSGKCRKSFLMGRRKVRWVENPSKVKRKTKKKKVTVKKKQTYKSMKKK